MTKRVWPRCSESGCDVAVREIAGSYPGKRQPEPDGRCSRHAITDTTYEAPTIVDVIEPDDAEGETEEVAVSSPKSIESLRVALSAGILNEDVVELLRSNLVAGLEAIKSLFATCPFCHKRHPVLLPDLGARATAAKTVIELLEGKLKEQSSADDAAFDREATKLRTDFSDMTSEELSRYIVRLEKEIAAEG